MKKYSYTQEEKLKQESDISLLFEKGEWKSYGKLRIVYFPLAGEHKRKIGVSVSKRYFKKAVDRNRIKRLLRESYRLHKSEFTDAFGDDILAMIFWVSSKKPSHYQDVEKLFLKLCEAKINERGN